MANPNPVPKFQKGAKKPVRTEIIDFFVRGRAANCGY